MALQYAKRMEKEKDQEGSDYSHQVDTSIGSTIANESLGYETNATADLDPDVIFETQDPRDANEDIPEVQVGGKKVPIATGKKRKCTPKGSDGLLERSDEQRKAMMQELRDSNIQMIEKMEAADDRHHQASIAAADRRAAMMLQGTHMMCEELQLLWQAFVESTVTKENILEFWGFVRLFFLVAMVSLCGSVASKAVKLARAAALVLAKKAETGTGAVEAVKRERRSDFNRWEYQTATSRCVTCQGSGMDLKQEVF
ncbi:hypothetical protein SELMODRAFT_424226 [Selaginella moellendorffii]|uniref:Uncharacterized protein n=1 Tax=Selaginella moellendorffii TaxID=88036 RepID=D8SP75_SELML|nr:hypothetical protein SELMODRAFT_424226 [Selaginella moellendorffii]